MVPVRLSADGKRFPFAFPPPPEYPIFLTGSRKPLCLLTCVTFSCSSAFSSRSKYILRVLLFASFFECAEISAMVNLPGGCAALLHFSLPALETSSRYWSSQLDSMSEFCDPFFRAGLGSSRSLPVHRFSFLSNTPSPFFSVFLSLPRWALRDPPDILGWGLRQFFPSVFFGKVVCSRLSPLKKKTSSGFLFFSSCVASVP